jgi:hypothetical protein
LILFDEMVPRGGLCPPQFDASKINELERTLGLRVYHLNVALSMIVRGRHRECTRRERSHAHLKLVHIQTFSAGRTQRRALRSFDQQPATHPVRPELRSDLALRRQPISPFERGRRDTAARSIGAAPIRYCGDAVINPVGHRESLKPMDCRRTTILRVDQRAKVCEERRAAASLWGVRWNQG